MEDRAALRPVLTLLSPRLLRFAMVGLSGIVVNLGSLFICADILGIPDRISSALAIEISIISNFLLNSAWTFRDRNHGARVSFLTRMYRYNLVSLIGGAIQWLTFVALTSLVTKSLGAAEPALWKYVAQLCGIALATVWNFLSNFYWTWAQRLPEETVVSTGTNPPAH